MSKQFVWSLWTTHGDKLADTPDLEYMFGTERPTKEQLIVALRIAFKGILDNRNLNKMAARLWARNELHFDDDLNLLWPTWKYYIELRKLEMNAVVGEQ